MTNVGERFELTQYIGLFLLYLLKIYTMKDIKPELQDVLLKVGKHIRRLRNVNTDKGYMKFAEDLQEKGIKISKNTLYRIETGSGDYSLLALISLLKHYDLKVSDFFKEVGL